MDDDKILQLLGAKIKEKRRELDITQEELARSINKSKGAISNLENAKITNPTFRHLSAVAKSLGMEVWELLKPDGHEDDLPRYPIALQEFLSTLNENDIQLREEEKKVLEIVKIRGKSPAKLVYVLFWLLQRGLSDAEVEQVLKVYED